MDGCLSSRDKLSIAVWPLSTLLILGLPNSVTAQIHIRIASWNIGDNQRMSGSFTDTSIAKVLGLDLINVPKEMPDIYVVGLQQECWMCNKDNLQKLAQRFNNRINEEDGRNSYEIIGVARTRNRPRCEEMCTLGSHGTLVLMEMGRKRMVKSHLTFNESKDCTGNLRNGLDTGVLAAKLDLADGKAICFATVHLESNEMKHKMNCLENFFKKAEERTDWTTECDAHFMFGDFNTKTGEITSGTNQTGLHFGKGTRFNSLKRRDQLTGVLPFESPGRRNLLGFINVIQKNIYKEGRLRFLPTFSVTDSKQFCDGEFPCYDSSQPLSWTDRIIHTKGKRTSYNAVYGEYGEHFPVFAEYKLFGDDSLVIGTSRKLF